ncbi:hypothetical protein HMI56_006787 [Coelomomyces lativittatus]|nr:hypothetical protein HMI56_006787 [Coelomomyces lativittatus]
MLMEQSVRRRPEDYFTRLSNEEILHRFRSMSMGSAMEEGGLTEDGCPSVMERVTEFYETLAKNMTDTGLNEKMSIFFDPCRHTPHRMVCLRTKFWLFHPDTLAYLNVFLQLVPKLTVEAWTHLRKVLQLVQAKHYPFLNAHVQQLYRFPNMTLKGRQSVCQFYQQFMLTVSDPIPSPKFASRREGMKVEFQSTHEEDHSISIPLALKKYVHEAIYYLFSPTNQDMNQVMVQVLASLQVPSLSSSSFCQATFQAMVHVLALLPTPKDGKTLQHIMQPFYSMTHVPSFCASLSSYSSTPKETEDDQAPDQERRPPPPFVDEDPSTSPSDPCLSETTPPAPSPSSFSQNEDPRHQRKPTPLDGGSSPSLQAQAWWWIMCRRYPYVLQDMFQAVVHPKSSPSSSKSMKEPPSPKKPTRSTTTSTTLTHDETHANNVVSMKSTDECECMEFMKVNVTPLRITFTSSMVSENEKDILNLPSEIPLKTKKHSPRRKPLKKASMKRKKSD